MSSVYLHLPLCLTLLATSKVASCALHLPLYANTLRKKTVHTGKIQPQLVLECNSVVVISHCPSSEVTTAHSEPVPYSKCLSQSAPPCLVGPLRPMLNIIGSPVRLFFVSHLMTNFPEAYWASNVFLLLLLFPFE